jgi:regulator of replication initiation timing
MANSRDDKPFVVFIDGSRYWLLIPPGDAGDSRLVKKNCQQLLESCDLLQLANLTPFVDDVVCAIQEYKKQQQIAIGSQCNRVMKHIQESAVYLYQYKDISEATVKNLHLAMKWLFEVRPPRVIGGRELLNAIYEVTRSVHATARKMFIRLQNAEKVVSETLDIITTNSIQYIRTFHEMVRQSLLFWKNLLEHLETCKGHACEINRMVQLDETINVRHVRFDQFKETVIRLSSGWRAIEKVSQQYIKNIKDEELKLLADGMRPIGLLEDFREFARNVDGNFQDLESKLILKQAENMQNKVAIYSTWVQPQLISEVRQCQGIVEEATKYVELGKVREAERKFIQVAQHSNRITTITKVYICRLEELEKYSVYQQEILMKKMEDLENKKKEKNKQIFQRLEEVSRKEQEKRCREAEKAKIKERREEAERNKRRAERRERDAKKWLLIPLIGLIPYLLDDSASDVRREESNIKECDDKIQSLERIIQNVQSEISNLKREVSNLNSEISNLKVESKRRNDTLLEIKQTTADLIQSIYHWTEFTSTVEDGAKKAKTIANFFIKASEKDDSSRILESKGTQTKVTSFQEAFAKAEELLEKQWDNLIVYVYTCEVCKKEKRGLPLPLDKDTVVCGECAHKFIEY